MKGQIISIALIFIYSLLASQDVEYARKIVKELSSDNYYGRGYVKKGDFKAAKFIAKEFKKDRLLKFNNSYFQKYSFPINSFPKRVSVKIDGKELTPGRDFVVSLSAPTTKSKYNIMDLRNEKNLDSIMEVITDTNGDQIFLINNEGSRKYYGKTINDIGAMAVITDKEPYWHVSNGGKIINTAWLKIFENAIPNNAKTITIDIKNKYFEEYKTQNVVGWVKGKTIPDKFVVFTAHYDHLGMMGSAMYPGANDNASGTAMVMDLARHFSVLENQPDYSVMFITLSGEETGLLGSTFFVDNSPVKMEDIELVVNLDMVGTGSKGITVVNATIYPELMEKMNSINTEQNLIPDIKNRSESCNSDHCPFYQKGVQAIFIYTRGDELKEYHTVDDIGVDFPFTAYDGLFTLLTELVK